VRPLGDLPYPRGGGGGGSSLLGGGGVCGGGGGWRSGYGAASQERRARNRRASDNPHATTSRGRDAGVAPAGSTRDRWHPPRGARPARCSTCVDRGLVPALFGARDASGCLGPGAGEPRRGDPGARRLGGTRCASTPRTCPSWPRWRAADHAVSPATTAARQVDSPRAGPAQHGSSVRCSSGTEG